MHNLVHQIPLRLILILEGKMENLGCSLMRKNIGLCDLLLIYFVLDMN